MKNISKVAVYGSLKKGRGNHHILHNAEYLGEIKIEPKFTLVSLGGFPGLVPNGTQEVKGELYKVDDETMRRLDWLEGHPHFYVREVVNTDKGEAWVYRLSDGYLGRTQGRNLPVVASGEW